MEQSEIELLFAQYGDKLSLLGDGVAQNASRISEVETDLMSLEELLVQTNELITRTYVLQLFVVGVACALGVLVLLYKFYKLFY